MRKKINIVWLKKDLRLIDHLPIFEAIKLQKPCLLLFCFEPSIQATRSWSMRHWQFQWFSLQAMQKILAPFGHQILIVYEEIIPVFEKLLQYFDIENVFSHEETGIKETYERDKAFNIFCEKTNINWKEYQTNGVIRGLKHRDNWEVFWKNFMQQKIQEIDLKKLETVSIPKVLLSNFQTNFSAIIDMNYPATFQPAGTYFGFQYLNSFLQNRLEKYMQHVSFAEASRKSCSRISPYLVYGNLSMRMVYQQKEAYKPKTKYKRNLNAFASRLYWHCHFIQKFEMQEDMQFNNLNTAFNAIRNEVNNEYLSAWKAGKTGYPLVDAAMRCVKTTGYINFRSRAMVVSFLCHHLWQPWQAGADYLAQQFLDFEPGIHFPQFQMQASTTGINTIRVYNPEKQAIEKDPQAVFVKKWVPELVNLPTEFALMPYKMTSLEQTMYQLEIGKDYPSPIVDIKKTRSDKLDVLWTTKRSKLAKNNNIKILKNHVSRNRKKT